jgi:hypothetical protein
MNDRALEVICRHPGMPAASTVRQWVKDDRGGFAARYRRARHIGRAKPGPATTYSAELADIIVARMASGWPLTQVCRDPGMPSHTTVRHWARQNHDGFAARLQRGRWLCLDAMADEIIDIAEHPREETITRLRPDGSSETVLVQETAARSELRLAARRSMMSKALGRGDARWWPEATEDGDTLVAVMREIEERNRKLIEAAKRDVPS